MNRACLSISGVEYGHLLSRMRFRQHTWRQRHRIVTSIAGESKIWGAYAVRIKTVPMADWPRCPGLACCGCACECVILIAPIEWMTVMTSLRFIGHRPVLSFWRYSQYLITVVSYCPIHMITNHALIISTSLAAIQWWWPKSEGACAQIVDVTPDSVLIGAECMCRQQRCLNSFAKGFLYDYKQQFWRDS